MSDIIAEMQSQIKALRLIIAQLCEENKEIRDELHDIHLFLTPREV